MARPREFDRQAALQDAMRVFWAKGFAATSTDDLLHAMGIGRQSLYNAFGDKRALYLEALDAYQHETISGHLARLNSAPSVMDGLRALLAGLVVRDDAERALGCMGVGSVCEFGATDPVLTERRSRMGVLLHKHLVQRLREGQAGGEIDKTVTADEAAHFIQLAMSGIQLAARSGAGAKALERIAAFTVERLRAR